MIEKWDMDDKARNPKTYLNKDESLKAFAHIFKEYHTKNIEGSDKKINPSKPTTMVEVFDSIRNTIKNDKEFHKFALHKYGLYIKYDKQNDLIHFGK